MRTLYLFAVLACFTSVAADSGQQQPLVLHFYYWDDRLAYESLRAHGRQVSLLSPVWLEVDDSGALVNHIDKDTETWATKNQIRVMPLVMNHEFRADSAAAACGAASRKLIPALVQTAAAHRFEGLQLDFEGLRPADRKPYAEFAERLAAALHDRGMQLSIALPAPLADDPLGMSVASQQSAAFDYARLAAAVDFVTLMAYDEYTSPEQPGPVAGIGWVEACLRQMLEWSPASKIMLGLPLYHRHWAAKHVTEGPYSAAVALAFEARSEITLDPTHQEATFHFSDANVDHVVWLETAGTLARRAALVGRYGLRGISAWRLGQEDPAVWDSVFAQKSEKTK